MKFCLEEEIYLSNIGRQMMDFFLPLFLFISAKMTGQNKKENFDFFSPLSTFILTSTAFLSAILMECPLPGNSPSQVNNARVFVSSKQSENIKIRNNP